jgi:hypothetical protein
MNSYCIEMMRAKLHKSYSQAVVNSKGIHLFCIAVTITVHSIDNGGEIPHAGLFPSLKMFLSKRNGTRGDYIVHRMTVVFPLQLGKGPKALRIEVGVPNGRESLPLRW